MNKFQGESNTGEGRIKDQDLALDTDNFQPHIIASLKIHDIFNIYDLIMYVYNGITILNSGP